MSNQAPLLESDLSIEELEELNKPKRSVTPKVPYTTLPISDRWELQFYRDDNGEGEAFLAHLEDGKVQHFDYEDDMGNTFSVPHLVEFDDLAEDPAYVIFDDYPEIDMRRSLIHLSEEGEQLNDKEKAWFREPSHLRQFCGKMKIASPNAFYKKAFLYVSRGDGLCWWDDFKEDR
jgi:hypothetical protein